MLHLFQAITAGGFGVRSSQPGRLRIGLERNAVRVYDPPRAQGNEDSSAMNSYAYRVARTTTERRDAFELVYQRYLDADLISSNPYNLRVTPWHLLPTTTVFVGLERGRVFCTVTLVADNEELGLPMERVYGCEVESRRRAGLKLGEVSCLAFRRGLSRRESWQVLLRLNRVMAQYARRTGIDALMIAAHPKHAAHYRRTMGFELIGKLRVYPSVRNHPAVACCMEFAAVDALRPLAYESLLGAAVSERCFTSSPMLPLEIQRLQRSVDFESHSTPLWAA